jgi:hypothetical protein
MVATRMPQGTIIPCTWNINLVSTYRVGETSPITVTEMSTLNLPGGKGRPAFKADSLTAICEPIV